MMKNAERLLISAFLLFLGGCSLIPNLSGNNARAILMPHYFSGQYGTQSEVNPNLSGDINHLILELRYATSLDLVATRDISKADLTNHIVFNNLRANTGYRVVANAYKTADTSQEISTDDSDSYTEFTTTGDDAPAIAPLKVQLKDVLFNGIGSSSIVVTPGSYTTGDSRLSVLCAGKVRTLAGIPSYYDASAMAATFNDPSAVALANGFLYVADTDNHRIRKIDLATNAVTTIAGQTTAGYADGTGTAAQFSIPRGLAVADGCLYIADGNRIRKLDLATNAVTTLAGQSSTGYVDATGTAAKFYTLRGITVASGSIYVADVNNSCVRKLDLATKAVTTVAGQSTSGFADGTGTAAKFCGPQGVVEAGGILYVSDSVNDRIRKIDLATSAVTTIPAAINCPYDLRMIDGYLYIMAGSCIHKLNLTTNAVSIFAGQGSTGYVDGTGTAAKFFNAYSFANVDGLLYIADSGNNRIRKIELSSSAVTTFAGRAQGYVDGTGSDAAFASPSGVAVANGSLYVADSYNHRIRKIDLASKAVTTFAGQSATGFADATGTAAKFYYPYGVAVANGFLYVADSYNHRIRKIDLANNAVTTLAGQSSYGIADGTGTAAMFRYPRGLAVADGFLYVADTDNDRIRKIDLETKVVSTVMINLNAPKGVAVSDGILYVSDDYHRIWQMDLASKVITTLAGQSAYGFVDAVGTAAKFQYPHSLAVEDGFLYVTDSSNNRIRKIDLATKAVTTLSGQTAAGSADGDGTAAYFSAPSGLTIDNGILYVADYTNNLIRAIY